MGWILAAVCLYLAVGGALYVFQRRLMYLPDKTHYRPGDVGLTDTSEVFIETADGERLQAWYSAPGKNRPVVIYLHGNAGSIAGRADRLAFLQQHRLGVLLVSFRGYGASTGSPSQAGLVNDGLAAYDWLVAKGAAEKDIVILGESLGTGVATKVAIRRKVAGLVLEAPFTSTVNVAKKRYWWLPVGLLLKDQFDSLAIIAKVNTPVMIVHGTRDEITDVSNAKVLFEAARQPKTLRLVEGASHTSISTEKIWREELDFMTSLPARTGPTM